MLITVLVLTFIIAKVDPTLVTALTGVALAGLAGFKAFTVDPRTSRLAERKENAELRQEVDNLYRDKRAAEDRERDALRRLDIAERRVEVQDQHIARLTRELDETSAQIVQLRDDVRKWRTIVGDIRGEGR